MAKLWYGTADVIKIKAGLAEFSKELQKLKIPEQHIYFDDRYDYKKYSTQCEVKITDEDSLLKIVKSLKKYNWDKSGTNYTSKTLKVKLYKSGGMRGSGVLPKKGEKQNTPDTSEQEMGSIVYLREAFKGKTPTLDYISKEVGYEFSNDWYWNFEQHYTAFKSEFGNLKSHKIYLDSETNDSNILIKLAKKLGLKDSKDNWNPSDIWIMNITKSKIIKETEDFNTLAQFNDYLVEKYKSKEIIGVSLKKISKNKKAKFDVVQFKRGDSPKFKIKRALFDANGKNFILETKGNISGLNIRVGFKAGSITKEGDIKVYLEGRMQGSDVQLGAVSASLFNGLTTSLGYDIAKTKQKIFKEPNSELTKYMKAFTNAIQVKNDSPINELQAKAGAMLAYYLYIFIKNEKNDLLEQCYYSSKKMNTFSSIHCKLH